VSIAAGVAAITSAFPVLLEHRVAIALALILVITVANLRGVRESATIFALPTYLFIAGMLVLIALGLYKFFSGAVPSLPVQPPQVPLQGITLFLILRAFTSGLTAVTGVEAISNGVTAFRPPEARNAGITMIAMSVTLGVMFIGISLLARFYNIVPVHGETVLSLIAKHIFGRNLFYYYIQASTAMILILAANTSYADFPRLASLLGKDGFLPRLLAMRGDRLVFSNGIITLGAAAALLIVIFQGDTHRLIPLYCLGVFLSFTLSQAGMVIRWFKLKGKGWQSHAVVNGAGATVTGIAVMVIAAFKFTKGAWVVVILIPLLVALLHTIHRHYDEVSAELDPNGTMRYKEVKPIFIIPIANINKVVVNTMEYAKSLSGNILAVHISLDPEASERLKEEWKKWGFGIELLVIPSPYRSIFGPLLRFIERVEAKAKDDERVTVLIPEFVTKKWWHYFLHNQTGLLLRTLLLLRKDIVISAVPYHLQH
ncbi:MAG: APC family permease, partial [Bacillota bacterium]